VLARGPMRLHEFIRAHPDAIEREWERFARTLTPFATSLSVSALRDHLREILEAIADDMLGSQTSAQQHEKSEGKDTYGDALDLITTAHANMRLDSGFQLAHAIAEYRALRAGILRLWAQTTPSREEQDLDEVIRFNETIDQAIAEITRRFADRATHYSDRFVDILAHDVRSPLNLINLAAESLLVDSSLETARVKDVSRILRGVRRIDRLVNDLGILVRHRASKPIPLTKTKVNLGVICEEALEEVKASHVDVVFEVQRLGDLTGNWDRERLAQVVTNLAVNAVVHASAKRVDLTLEDQGPFVVAKVTNRGNPIPADMLESIFDPLVRHDQHTSNELSSGLGLGLFIVREIAQAHGGTVQVRSSAAEGTTFSLRLPRSSL
jgi:signal transduction histidine kinase